MQEVQDGVLQKEARTESTWLRRYDRAGEGKLTGKGLYWTGSFKVQGAVPPLAEWDRGNQGTRLKT